MFHIIMERFPGGSQAKMHFYHYGQFPLNNAIRDQMGQLKDELLSLN